MVFVYTVKGWGLPIAGNPRNHSALLTSEQIGEMRARLGLTPETEWDRFDPMTPAGQWTAARREHLARPPRAPAPALSIPDATGLRASRALSTQEAFGRILVDLSRQQSVAPYLVTVAPDVATSTNLAGFINRVRVFSPDARRAWTEDPVLKWAEGPEGQHIELGISEMNLFLLLGQLGLAWDLSGQPLLPVGTVYDPFVLRGLDAFIYSVYSGARFIVAGHAVRGHPGAGGRRAPVHDHRIGRPGTARGHVHRAGLCDGAGLADVRRAAGHRGRAAASAAPGHRRPWKTARTTSG